MAGRVRQSTRERGGAESRETGMETLGEKGNEMTCEMENKRYSWGQENGENYEGQNVSPVTENEGDGLERKNVKLDSRAMVKEGHFRDQ